MWSSKPLDGAMIRAAVAIAAAAFAALLYFLYLNNVTKQGLWGADVFTYLEIAHRWAQGNFTFSDGWTNPHVRPVAFALYGLAIKLIGFTDYSIKLFNVMMAGVSIGLTYAIARALTTGRMVSLLCACVLALTPEFIFEAREELLHIPSTPFVLSAFLAYIAFHKRFLSGEYRAAFGFIFLCGVASSFAWNLHPSLALVGPAFAVVVLIAMGPTRVVAQWRLSLAVAASYCAGYVSLIGLYAIVGLVGRLFGYVQYMTSWGRPQTDFTIVGIWHTLVTVFDNLVIITSLPAVIIFIGSGLILLFAFSKAPSNILSLSPWIFVNSFLLALILLVSLGFMAPAQGLVPRILLPLMPLVVIANFRLLELMFKSAAISYRVLAVSVGVLLWLGPSMLDFTLAQAFDRRTDPPGTLEVVIDRARGQASMARVLFNEIGTKVTRRNKLLIVPSLAYSHRRIFAESIYFGMDNVRYLVDCRGGSLSSFIENEQIRYVYFSPDLDERIIQQPKMKVHDPETHTFKWLPRKLGSCLGMNDEGFSDAAERDRLLSFLQTNGFKQVAMVNGQPLFVTPQPPQTAPDSTVAARALYDLLGSKVTGSNKLLIVPSLAYSANRTFSETFGENRVRYLVDCRSGKLASFIEREQIKYVYFSADLDESIIHQTHISVYDLKRQKLRRLTLRLGSCLGLKTEEYSEAAERERLLAFLKKSGFTQSETVAGQPLFVSGH